MAKHDMYQIKTNSLLAKKLMINNNQLISRHVSKLKMASWIYAMIQMMVVFTN